MAFTQEQEADLNELNKLFLEENAECENLKSVITLTSHEWLPDGKLEIVTSIDDYHVKLGVDWLKMAAPAHQRRLESYKQRKERMQKIMDRLYEGGEY